ELRGGASGDPVAGVTVRRCPPGTSRGAESIHHSRMAMAINERAHVGALQAQIDRGDGAKRRHPAVAASRADRIASGVLPEHPTHRPLERFWPYADLPEAPSDEELALLHPELREALFGTP